MVVRQPRGGTQHQKIDAEMMDYLVGKIEVKPNSTLKELHEQMKVNLPNKPTVTYQAISKKLDGLFFTVKDIRTAPVQWNTPTAKVERRQFTTKIL